MAEKPKLSEAIKEGFASKNKSTQDGAHDLGFPTESFRVRLSRNRFNVPDVLKIAKYFGWTEDITSLQKKYTFELTTRFMNPRRPNQVKISFTPEFITANALSNLLPLIKVIAESDVELVSYDEFIKLLQFQDSLKKELTPDFVKSLLHVLRTPPS
jgi:hypothetical protein